MTDRNYVSRLYCFLPLAQLVNLVLVMDLNLELFRSLTSYRKSVLNISIKLRFTEQLVKSFCNQGYDFLTLFLGKPKVSTSLTSVYLCASR